MDLIQQPELKRTYAKCKYRVKLWEHEFKKKNGRLPSKLDIKEATREVRLAYKTYFNLKSAALEKSFKDIEGFNSDDEKSNTLNSTFDDSNNVINATEEFSNLSNALCDDLILNNSDDKLTNNEQNQSCLANLNFKDIWGEHLNNSIEKVAKEQSAESNVNSTFTKKLFVGSKFSKRNPRKSLSFHHRKSESNLSFPTSLSQPNNADSYEYNKFVGSNSQPDFAFNNEENVVNVKFIPGKPLINNQTVNVVQSVLNNEYKPKIMLDSGWIERVAKKSGTELSNDNINENFKCSQNLLSYYNNVAKCDDNDDIIGNSDEDDYLHVSKKIKIDDQDCVNAANVEIVNVNETIKSSTSNEMELQNTKHKIEEELKTKQLCEDKNSIKVAKSKVITKKTTGAKLKSKTIKKTQENQKIGRKSTRSKKLTNLKEDSSSSEDDEVLKEKGLESSEENTPKSKRVAKTIASKNVRKSRNNDEAFKKQTITPKSKKQLKTTNKNTNDENVDEIEDSYELEYSIKPRIVSVPRLSNVKVALKSKQSKTDNTTEKIVDKKQQEKDKLEKKIATGNLNENFVRINLRKKVFVRGKKNMNFSKYKKQMWKNKKKALTGPDMDMGGCDGGTLTCFNCGQVGHFARQCKAKGDILLPLEAADEEICPYPTLEEVAKIAQSSALAIRKPNINSNKDMDDETESLAEIIEEFGDSDDDDLLEETFKLEEYVAKIDMKAYMDSTKFVKPYFELDEHHNVIDTPIEVLDTLKKFGHESFRPGQERAVMRILSGKSTLVTLSTGSGKSLCYQLPAYIYSQREPCISLIISPLVSLMEDQVIGLPDFLKAACLHTNQTKTQREKVMDAILSGSLSILLVSPEAVAAGEKSSGFGSLLRKLPPIAFACIDEAHCVSQWSHNFRPSYLMICRILRERLGVNTILGLTATATRSTGDSIIHHLQIPDGREGIISDVPLPDNLRLTVSKDFNRDQALLNLLMSDRFASCKSIIVYCTRREVCERVATFLRTTLKEEKQEESNNKKRKRINVQAEPYHAGMSASRRRTIQKSFMNGELRIVVATVAFGMGINKCDIRAVIHYNMPSNFESYVQEVGRAGRDGLLAHCHMFLDAHDNDESELRRHIHANSMDRHVIRKLLQKVFVPCSCKTVCPKHEVAFSIQETIMALDIPEENISTLLCYLELHENCYIQVLSPAYVTCKVISYGGPVQIRKAAKECPPLAMALALHCSNSKEENVFEFPVIDVAAAIGWDSGICKHKLKNLEWITVNNQPKRSTLTVYFSNLGFRLLAPGNLNDMQLDEALDSLYERVVDQENKGLLQLHAIHSTLLSVTEKTYRTCITDETSDKENILKAKIREYFESPNPLQELTKLKTKPINEDVIISDTRQLVGMYRDNSFTGRAVARIFHGIQSPNYPAVIWGRCKFWRSHLKDDFNTICQIATQEIIKMR